MICRLPEHNGLTHYQTKIFLDWSKLNKLQMTFLSAFEMKKKVSYRVENIVRKGEIASYKQLLTMFSRAIYMFYLSCTKMRYYVVMG